MSQTRRARDVAEGFGWNLLAEALVLPTGLVTAAFLGRVLGPAGYGLFALASSIVAVLEWVLAALFSRAVLKLTAGSREWEPLAATAIRLHLAIGLAIGAALVMAAGPIATWLDEPSLATYLRWFALEIPIFGLFAAARNVQAGTGQFRLRALASGTRWTSRLVLLVLFVGAGLSVPGAIAGSIGAVLVGCAVAHAGLRLTWWRGPGAPAHRVWRLALPLFVLALSLRVFDKLGLFVLKGLGATTSDAGLYAAAQNLAIAPTLLAQAATPLLLSSLAAASDGPQLADARNLAGRSLKLTLWLLPFATFCAGAAGEIMRLAYGERFAGGATSAVWLIPGSVGSVSIAVATALLIAADRWRLALAIALPLSAAATAGLLVVVPAYGGAGAAFVTMAVALAGGLAGGWAAARVWHVRIGIGTAATVAVSSIVVYAAAAGWKTDGMLLLIKAAMVTAFIVGLLLWRGDLDDGWIEGRPAAPAGAAGAVADAVHDGAAWNLHTRRFGERQHHLDSFLGNLKRNAYLSLLERWDAADAGPRILKTDLFEEAFGPDAFLHEFVAAGRSAVGIDVSSEAAGRAKARFAGTRLLVAAADVRRLPFRDSTFDCVVSPSTLDHFSTTADIDKGLEELARVVRPGGLVIVTLDNPRNVTDFVMRLAGRAGLLPFPLGVTYDAAGLSDALIRARLEVRDTTAIIHHPRMLGTAIVKGAATLRSPMLHRAACSLLLSFQRFQDTRWQYLTGCFVAACAVKR